MLNQFEWMLLNGDRLADMIASEGSMNGPETDKLLTEVQQLECSGRVKDQARKLLKQKLEHRGVGYLLP